MSAFGSKAQSSVSTAERDVPLRFTDSLRSWWVTSEWKMTCLLVEGGLWDSVFLKSLSHVENISMLTTSRPLRCAQLRLEFLCNSVQCYIKVKCTWDYDNLRGYNVCALLRVQATKMQAVQLETWLYCLETEDDSSTMSDNVGNYAVSLTGLKSSNVNNHKTSIWLWYSIYS